MLVAVSMVRDERDIIGYTVQHLLDQGVDRVVIADNLSTDGTPALLRELFGDLVEVRKDDDLAYRQAEKMSALAEYAADPGDWVIPFDADEAWSNVAALRDLDADRAPSRPYVHVPKKCQLPPMDRNPLRRYPWRIPTPEKFPKVAFRYQPGAQIHMGNHGVDGVGTTDRWDVVDIRHFQYRSIEQVRRKVGNGVQAYDALPAHRQSGYGTHWRDLHGKPDDELAEWWDAYITQDLEYAPCPRSQP